MNEEQALTMQEPASVSSTDPAGDASASTLIRAVDQELLRCCEGIAEVDAQLLRGQLDLKSQRSLRAAIAQLIGACTLASADEPAYARVACRLLAGSIDRELASEGISRFSESIARAADKQLLNPRVAAMARTHGTLLDAAIRPDRTGLLDHSGLQVLVDTYLLRDPDTGRLIEDAQIFWMRLAAALADSADDAIALYDLMSRLEYLPSEETLRHAGSAEEYLSSCYLLDSPAASPAAIRGRLQQVSDASHAVRDVSVAWHGARTSGSLTDTLDGSGLPASVDLRSTCVYIEPWHVDVERYLSALEQQLRPDGGHNHAPALAHWIPDLFMQRVEAGAQWSLFDPADVPLLPQLFGEDFERAYEAAEQQQLARRTLPARQLFARIIELIAADGRSWIDFKDNANRAANQTGRSGNVIHAANLCSEILEVTSDGEPAVCHVGAINLAHHLEGQEFDMERFARTVRVAVRQLDAAIDRNRYALPAARAYSERWRPIGLGIMGLQDVFFSLRLPFDSFDARQLSTRIAEALYFHALDASAELAAARGAHPAYSETRATRGELQLDSWGITPSDEFDWAGLRARIARSGLRNSLLIAIGPTATLSSIASCFECIEPQISNTLHRRTSGGHVTLINPYLVAELKQLGLWNESMRSAIRLAGGSIQGLYQLPEATRTLYRTAWEVSALAMIDLAADRGAFVDQSQSLQLFVATPSVARLSQLYFYAWRCRLKTTYTLRTRLPLATADDAGDSD